jgi:hypothetical protein
MMVIQLTMTGSPERHKGSCKFAASTLNIPAAMTMKELRTWAKELAADPNGHSRPLWSQRVMRLFSQRTLLPQQEKFDDHLHELQQLSSSRGTSKIS